MFHKILKPIIFFYSLFLLSGCSEPPVPETPKGILRIATVPTDMPIIVDGQPKGNSPSGEGQYFSISLEEGDHKIEILRPIDEEKEMYAAKNLFLAADTVPIVSLEAKERLTPFGEEEKARREAEAVEKARLAEIERNKAAEIAAEKKRQAKIKAANAAKALKVKTIKQIESNMVNIPSGSFIMGSEPEASSHKDEQPARLVSIQPFLINKYEVTVDEFTVFARDTSLNVKGCEYFVDVKTWIITSSEKRVSNTLNWSDPPQFNQKGNHPVVCVDQPTVKKFIEWLNKNTQKKYRLPSEAEWEYAARAGTNTEYYWGDEAPRKRANCDGYCSHTFDYTSPVGEFPANPWGLFDTVGNAAEWVEDCYVNSYENAPVNNTPRKTDDCKTKVFRGGNWSTSTQPSLKPRYRNAKNPAKADNRIGFRLARDG